MLRCEKQGARAGGRRHAARCPAAGGMGRAHGGNEAAGGGRLRARETMDATIPAQLCLVLAGAGGGRGMRWGSWREFAVFF